MHAIRLYRLVSSDYDEKPGRGRARDLHSVVSAILSEI